MMPMFVSVFLGGGPQNCCEVPVTPNTLCRDVLRLCKEPGENRCCLTETWRGDERVVGEEEKMMEVLQRWGQHSGEVSYLLRRLPHTGVCRAADHTMSRGLVTAEDDEVLVSHRETALSDLKDLAARQQRNINDKEHLLASKEQHLWRLRHEDCWATLEEERVRRLRENAIKQEAKLRRVRALKGQVELKRISNSKLASELEHTTVLFQQKQKELMAGSAHVEQLSEQLEALRSGITEGGGSSSSSAAELQQLRGELQLRNRLNQEQNSRLQQQKDALSRKNQEVATMERRVAELRLRLCKKKAGLKHKENTPVPSDSEAPQHATSKVAAVGPYIQSPCQGPPFPQRQEVPLKSIYPNGTATLPVDNSPKPPPPQPPRPLKPTAVVNKISDWSSSNGGPAHIATLPRMTKLLCSTSEPNAFKGSNVPPPVPTRINHTTEKLLRDQKVAVLPGITNCKTSCTGTFPVKMRASGGALHSSTLPLPHKQENPPAAAVPPYTPEPLEPLEPLKPMEPLDPLVPLLQKPQTVAAASIYSMYTQRSMLGKSYQSSTLPRCQTRVYGKPALQASGGQQSDSCAINSGSLFSSKSGVVDANCLGKCDASGAEPATERATPRPLSPTKLLPFLTKTNSHRNHSDADLEAMRRRHHAPRPLKKRSSITEPEGPAGPNIQKLLYQKTTLAAMETIPMETIETIPVHTRAPVSEHFGTSDMSDRVALKQSLESPKEPSVPPRSHIPISASCRSPPTNQDVKEEAVWSVTGDEFPPYPPPPYPLRGDAALNLRPPEGTKSILRTSASVPADRIVRVKFNPLAVLLDASLEGEYDLVQRVIYEVDDPSGANDEGITALHNAVCAGHGHIVHFLVHFGIDVNAADSDGWTPLHCAASCNNVEVCKFLVESGAAALAVTHSDAQTAADKCEEMDDGYAQCSHFLYGVQEKMGVMNRGEVYGLWDYEAQSEDEMSFETGDCMTVLRKDEQADGEWWWACCGDRQGFIPRNLLGLYPRIRPRHRSLA
ncbi:apoptosis-stimulating of p53 protein 2-like isoform X2 [Phycodurus eques]|uniref:apoptosis-stimulating of p53 protein 2-like isoform X2 n=1 Tax=Phycodurus eques TaxID=693459 RepID=UPI002ACDDC6A|nr:apoptosis-stimulating of p53 protein 2-like isoform X2 [Phycodurus eques]